MESRHTRNVDVYVLLLGPMSHTRRRLAGLAPVDSWPANIHKMLTMISTLYSYEMDHHFDSIDCRISLYESWRQVPTLLGQIIPNNDIVFKILSYF